MIEIQGRVRWGIIGCGQIAVDKAVPGISASKIAEVVALSDPDSTRLERAGGVVPSATRYDDIHEMLKDPTVDAVYIATPNVMHPEQAIAALNAGKHVLVEKPMALTHADGRRMLDAARATGKQLMVAYMTLFNPAYETAKHWVQRGSLGEIVAARGRHSYVINRDGYSPAAAWRLDDAQGGGPLMDVAIYPIATIRDLLGTSYKKVSATGTTTRLEGLTAFDSVAFTFLLENGVPGVIEAGFTFSSSSFEIEGTLGRLTLSGHVSQITAGELVIELYGEKGQPSAEILTHVVSRDGTPHYQNYFREADHFSQCILQGTKPIASGDIAMQDLAVTDAVRRSIQTGQQVFVTTE